jgi:hypothetical protein
VTETTSYHLLPKAACGGEANTAGRRLNSKSIDRSEASCLRVTDVRGRVKVVWQRAPFLEASLWRESAHSYATHFYDSSASCKRLGEINITKTTCVSFSALYNCKSAELDDALGYHTHLFIPAPRYSGPQRLSFTLQFLRRLLASIPGAAGFFSLRCSGDNELTAC